MRDFTSDMFSAFLDSFKKAGYSFLTYEQSLSSPTGRFVILRHDIDKHPSNALRMARLENAKGIEGSYYFRAERDEGEYIRAIAALGHEIGYHYEDLAAAGGDMQKAKDSFVANLEFFRQFYPVSTICMHGSPVSKFDNRLIWAYNDYHDFKIAAEPYFDIDVTDILYLSDTGRRWDGSASIRDRSGIRSAGTIVPEWNLWRVVPPANSMIRDSEHLSLQAKYNFKTTSEIMDATAAGEMPGRIMINIHPQRWNDNFIRWSEEYITQNIKNIVKRIIKTAS